MAEECSSRNDCSQGIDQWSFKQVRVENAVGTGSEFDGTDSDEKKFLIPSDMLLRKFVQFLRGYSRKPMFVFFKNTTQPPTGVLMSAIDEENKDSDGYLHVIYSGNDHLSGLFEELKLSS
ncbi:PREDICTED: autophagy-related [Prunus dulcis]|uniref:Autophagy-related protein n=1 Tax=Prunus dulcis TaxID=3755 RepID=A0A5E4F9G0_PRUDU|nr:PREDICTED: autophagy-related [Prunus dulcis]